MTFSPANGWRKHHITAATGWTSEAGTIRASRRYSADGAASADHGDRRITFQIKALGDYTRGLAHRLQSAQPVKVEGPYGRFNLDRRHRRAQQIWIAGSIGITPFLAWLESLQADPTRAPSADLHYCTRDRNTDTLAPRLVLLCANLPGIRLHVHGAQQGEALTLEGLTLEGLTQAQNQAKRTEIWFCGPRAFADKLRQGFQQQWTGRVRFHQEAFELR